MDDFCNKGWPMLLDMTKQECKQTLRALELTAYSQLVSVFRAQGELTKEKKKLLQELQAVFSITLERHRAEIRRAVNDEILNTIANVLAGPNNQIEWSIEGRRLIPLLKRVPPQVAYTALATRMAEVYCGINTKTPKPSETPIYGKLDDVGAEFDLTDSEEETEGLRFITEAMVPRHINPTQGSYTTLPLSQARVDKENVKKKREKELEKQQQKETKDDSSMDEGSPQSSPTCRPRSGEKRKRSISIEKEPSILPPGVTQASSLLNFHHTSSIRQQHPTLNQPSMKITVPGSITRGSTPPIATPMSQKVILVSTTASVTPNFQQRSINLPILKSSPQGSLGALSSSDAFGQPNVNVIKGSASPAVAASAILGVGSSLASKIRPRFSSMTSSILSQGSSSLPGLPPRPPRQRSNSLILHADGHSLSSITKKEGILPRATSGPTILPDSSSGGPLNFLGSSNLQHLRGGSVMGVTNKPGIQVRPDGTKLTGSTGSLSGVLGNRVLGRSPSQGVFMVSTTAGGTITVVTRTVASAGSLVSPRVVTMNTVSNVRSSIVRGSLPTTVLTMGKPIPQIRQTINVRPPIIGVAKTNVIVVHKGSIPNSPRPMQVMRPRELSTKIFTKPMNLGLAGTSGIVGNVAIGSKLASGLLAGTLIVKPSVVGKSISLISNKDELSHVPAETLSGPTNLLVLDYNLKTPSPTTSVSLAPVIPHPSQVKEDITLDVPNVTASSAVPVFKELLLTTDPATISVEAPIVEKKSTNDYELPTITRIKKRSLTSLNEAADDDNEWLKLGLELDEALVEDSSKKECAIKQNRPKGTKVVQEKEGEMQMMVEKVVEALNGGHSVEARTILHQAGFELIDPACAEENYSISSLPGDNVTPTDSFQNTGIAPQNLTPTQNQEKETVSSSDETLLVNANDMSSVSVDSSKVEMPE